jgi:hypothetical protein
MISLYYSFNKKIVWYMFDYESTISNSMSGSSIGALPFGMTMFI